MRPSKVKNSKASGNEKNIYCCKAIFTVKHNHCLLWRPHKHDPILTGKNVDLLAETALIPAHAIKYELICKKTVDSNTRKP